MRLSTLRAWVLLPLCVTPPLLRAEVVEVSNGAFAAVVVTDCRSAAAIAAGSQTPDRCRFGTGPNPPALERSQQLVLGGTVASAQLTRSLAMAGGAVSGVVADASAIDGSLQIKGGSFSGTPYSRVGLIGDVTQSYLYTGPDGATRSIRHDAHVLSSVTPSSNMGPTAYGSNSPAPATLLGAFMTVFSLDTPTVQINTATGVGGGQFVATAYQRPDYRLEAESSFYPLYTSNASEVLSFVAHTGRYYFVEISILLHAQFGALADARHTMAATLGFGDANNFVAGDDGFQAAAAWAQPLVVSTSVGAVPEPSTGAMWLAALSVAVLWVRRRRRGARIQVAAEPSGGA